MDDNLRRVLETRHDAYKRTFTGTSGVKVLKDLEKFCRANASTFRIDQREHALLEGRREVWLRIQKYLRLTPEELIGLTTGEIQTIERD